ncbi:MAG: pyruvate formate lyase family protein, partial [Bacilli bacterium]
MKAWRNFNVGQWSEHINVRDFIQSNYIPYEGNGDFLVGPSVKTSQLLDQFQALLKEERQNKGVLDVETSVVSQITSYEASYIDRDNEVIVGLQTDKPLKRPFHPFGGIQVAVKA